MKLLLIFAPPAIIGLLINASYNLIDRIFVGNGIGALGLAAITVCFPSMILQLALGLMVGIGGSVNFAVSLGQKKIPRAEKIFTNSVMLIVILALLFTIVHLFFAEPLLRLYGATPTIMPHAKTYLSIICLGSVFMMTNMTLNNFIRASSFPRFAMCTMLIGAIANTILDALFIFVFKWGIVGAAAATVIAQAVSFLWASSFFISSRAIYRFRKKYIKLSPKIVSAICFVGAAPFLIQITNGFMQTLINKSLIQYGGDIAVSAMGATLAVTILLFMPITGLCEGMQPVIGFNLGAEKYDRMLKIFRLNLIASTVFFIFGWGVLQLFPETIIRVFNNRDQELITIGTQSLKTISLLYPFIGLPIATTFFLQAVKHPSMAAFLAVGRQLLFIIPSLLILPRYFGLNGVFYAFPTADLLGFFVAVPITVQQFRKYGKKQRESETTSVLPEAA
ncbi:MAG: MATE family efflux transporter [Alphaproteobacteria bacterium]|nr:MATE family efflux transporter [Alphaproteobacteria bacterium]